MEFISQSESVWRTTMECTTRWGYVFLDFMNPDLTLDKRVTRDWLLTSPIEALLVIAAYTALVVVGPLAVRLTAGSEEATDSESGYEISISSRFKKEPVLVLQTVYNLIQVVLCAFMTGLAMRVYSREKYSLVCNDFNPARKGMASVVYIFYLSKIFDFCDTLFIILRRKWRQLSFLHIYHHLTIYFVYWVNMNIGYDGDIYATVIINSIIHFIMYTYYLLRTVNISVPKPIKALITNLQMFQFLIMNVQAIYLLINSCPYPRRLTVFYLVYIVSLLALFRDFSKKEYGKKRVQNKRE